MLKSKAAQQTLCGLCAGIRLCARGSLALSAQSNLLLNATYQIVQAEWLDQAQRTLIDRKHVGELAVGGHKNHRHIRASDLRKVMYKVHSIRTA